MTIVRWKPSTRTVNPVTLMSTELNSLAAGSAAITSTAVQNGDADAGEFDLYMDLELEVSYEADPVQSGVVDVCIVRSVDSLTTIERYVTGATEWPPGFGRVGHFPVDDYSNATPGLADQAIILPKIEIPPFDFHLYVTNYTEQAFPSSGNTIRGFFYSLQHG